MAKTLARIDGRLERAAPPVRGHSALSAIDKHSLVWGLHTLLGDAPADGDMSGTKLNGPIIAASGS